MSIGIFWHMTEGGRAVANRAVEGCLRVYEGEKDYLGATIDIFMPSAFRAALAAAAINGDLVEIRRLLGAAAAAAQPEMSA